MQKPRKWNRNGMFTLPGDRQLFGDLALQGKHTMLTLYAKSDSELRKTPTDCIHGSMYDLQKVSLFNCIQMEISGHGNYLGEKHSSSRIFPEFVIYGDQHLRPNASTIYAIDFLVDDAETLCYDFDAFSHAANAKPFIDAIVEANAKQMKRKISVGPEPAIAYFTGRFEIFSIETALGKLSAAHRPARNMGGPSGIWIKNNIYLTLEFEKARIFADAISPMFAILQYVALLVGRSQNLLSFHIRTTPEEQAPRLLHVYWPIRPRRKRSEKGENAAPMDILLSPISNLESFARVTKRWIERQADWNIARNRFFSSFRKQNVFDIDRLIRSANMFDTLPSSAVPADVILSPELAAARESTRKLFRSLPQSSERDSILGDLGRLGKSKLKHKVRHRAQYVVDKIGDHFPDLFDVLNNAIEARNYFVHGRHEQQFDYAEYQDVLPFLTDTLEFVFGCSDLVEAGWDAVTWCDAPSAMSHPFARYRVTYKERLARYKHVLNKQ